MGTIPKRFIRIWLGKNEMPSLFEEWWNQFKELHKDYEFMSITDANNDIFIPPPIEKIYRKVDTYAGRSDIIRLLALYYFGGIYVDTDMMPLKSFDPLVKYTNPFIGKRSGVSFANGVIGSPAKHIALKELLFTLPKWYSEHVDSAASVQTGPAFVSSVWFGRKDVVHMPIEAFYPYNGFMAPKKEERDLMFKDKKNFPKEMYAAHYGSHNWGGKPKD